MADTTITGDEASGGCAAVSLASVLTKGDRNLYKVELRPDETTIVSWRKLAREGNRQLNGSSSAIRDTPSCPGLRPAPEHTAEIEGKDGQTANRYSSVIEKIERLYMGNDSNDEDDLRDIPHDDEYDTEDSFIDDTELDEYFQVDYAATKHDGFFINRGKLESIQPPAQQPERQAKKRGRADNGKAQGETDSGHVPNKRLKGAKITPGKITTSHENKNHTQPQSAAVAVGLSKEINAKKQQHASKTNVRKKQLDGKMTVDPSSVRVQNGNPPPSVIERKDIYQQNTGTSELKICKGKLKAAAGTSHASHQNCKKIASVRPLYNVDEQETSARPREDSNLIEQSQKVVQKSHHTQKRDASGVKSKSSMLEKAIRELEKMVAESRPPAMENQEADAMQQATKRRLPREIKQKLAKVARLAQVCHGKISEDLLKRLMSFLGHLMQLRTLKRNLKEMINMGLSSKQEKNDKFQGMKKELTEMIKVKVPVIETKEPVQQAGGSDDFQKYNSEDKEARKRSCLDAALEDKICDIYDCYVDGLDEDARPLIRKLYAELAQLWPNNLMDNHGIKQAICNAKERQRALHGGNKDQERNKRKKVMPTQEEPLQAKASSVAQPQNLLEDGGRPDAFPASGNKQMPSTTTAIRMDSPSTNGPSLDMVKSKLMVGSSGNDLDAAKPADDNPSKKKKKPEVEFDGSNKMQQGKLLAHMGMGEQQLKSHKQPTLLPHQLSVQPAASFFDQSS